MVQKWSKNDPKMVKNGPQSSKNGQNGQKLNVIYTNNHFELNNRQKSVTNWSKNSPNRKPRSKMAVFEQNSVWNVHFRFKILIFQHKLTSFLIRSCFLVSVQQFSHCNSDSMILLTPVLIWLNARRQFDLSYRIDLSFKRSPLSPHSVHNSSSSTKRSPNRELYRSTTTCRFSTDFALGSLAASVMK